MVFEQLSDTLFWISPKSSAFIMEALVLAGEHGKYTVVSELTFVYGGDFVSALSALLIAYIAGDGNFFQKRGFEMYEDKTLVCKECGNEFVFTAGEQEFYAERGFQNEPQRCKTCRDARKNAARGPREFFTAVCAACGGEAKVPFEPQSDRPVYCSECFAKMREQA